MKRKTPKTERVELSLTKLEKEFICLIAYDNLPMSEVCTISMKVGIMHIINNITEDISEVRSLLKLSENLSRDQVHKTLTNIVNREKLKGGAK